MLNSSRNISRRKFIKIFGNGMKVGLTVSSFPALSLSDCGTPYSNDVSDWTSAPGVAKQRIEGLAKVLGQKIYARDFRASDIETWPDQEQVLYAVRCDRVDEAYEVLNLDVLPKDLQPVNKITQETIDKDNICLPYDMTKPFFVSPGAYPDYYGQPVALLIFKNFRVFRKASKILQFNPDVIRYQPGSKKPLTENTEPPKVYEPTFEYVRDDAQNFSYVNNYAAETQCLATPIPAKDPCSSPQTTKTVVTNNDYYENQNKVAASILKEMEQDDYVKVSRDFITQSVDPMFMEPEAGMAWFDKSSGTLHLLLGTQSPSGDLSRTASIYANPDCSFKLKDVELLSCFPGGGFGGRDSSYFPNYLALAAAYADGPVRWAFSRFEQFQVGLKRHYSKFSETLAFTPDGQLSAMSCQFTLNGGGRENLSPYVAQLAVLSSPSAYNIPKAVGKGESLNTKDLIGGSQRGFGGPQAFIAIETLMDEAAEKLQKSPFELRRINALTKQGKTITGAPVEQELLIEDILNELEKQPAWQKRTEQQARFAKQGLKYGVGLALSNQAYGTSGDGMYGAVEINPDSSIKVRSPYIDMGNGAATTLGLAPATWLGQNAQDIVMGEACFFNALDLTTSICDKASPKYVIKGSGSSSACLGAFYQQHVVEQAAHVLLISSVLPALTKLWGKQVSHTDLFWTDGMAFTSGVTPVSWQQICQQIFKDKLPTISAVHGSYVGEFATADYAFSDGSINLPLDYVALGTSSDNLTTVRRSNVHNPPLRDFRYGRSTYAPSGALIAVIVDPKTGEVQVDECVCAVNSGKLLSPQLVSGQYQGAIAMAIGYALSEDCPNTPQGPGNGTWNLDKYKVAHMTDVPKKQKLIPLKVEGETTARGIAEAVLCPLPPAILNALAMATGHRFTQLPVTAEAIKARTINAESLKEEI